MFQRLDNFPRKTNEYFSICTNICVWLYDIIQDIANLLVNYGVKACQYSRNIESMIFYPVLEIKSTTRSENKNKWKIEFIIAEDCYFEKIMM